MKSDKKIKRLAAVAALGIILFVGGRAFIFWRIEEKISHHFAGLQAEGIVVQYKTLEVSAWKSSIQMTELEIKFPASDTACAATTSAVKVEIEGLSLLPLIFSNRFHVKSIRLTHPVFHHAENFKRNKKKSDAKDYLKEIEVGEVRIDSGIWETMDSTKCFNKLRTTLDFTINDLKIQKPGQDSAIWSATKASAKSITIEFPTHFYKITVKEIAYTKSGKSIRVDSLHMEPTLDKLEFARATGHQADQFTFSLPLLEANGFEIGPSFQPTVKVGFTTLQFQLAAYRDKRFPRAQRKPRIMPMQFLHELPYQLKMDSIKILPSFISYEEFPENGTETGKIFFDNLQAGIYNVSNDSTQEARMKVTSRFMNAGDLQAEFTFPGQIKKQCTAKGSLSQFSMPELNGMLIPVASIKVESGILDQMKFNFRYNEWFSEGKLEIHHHDLKVLSMRKDDKTTNKLASLVLSIFVKKDIDKGNSKEQRTGDIHWERDAQKGILNYWWKSILSGIKAVYKVENLMGKEKKQKSK